MEGSYFIYSLSRNILLLLLLFTSSITLISALDKTNIQFIRTSCGLTTYPALCFNSLSTQAGVERSFVRISTSSGVDNYESTDRIIPQIRVLVLTAGAIQTSPKLLAQTALSVTLDTTRSTSLSMVKLSQVHGMAPRDVAAMKDCIELLSDSVYELKSSLDEMSRPGSKDFRLVMSDVQTWVSSAMTDENTCSEGFVNDPKMKNVVRGKIVNVAHLTSNALALINSYASLNR